MKTDNTFDEKQVKVFAKHLKKTFKYQIDGYVSQCLSGSFDLSKCKQTIQEESLRIMMRAAMLAYMKAGLHMSDNEIKIMVRNLKNQHGSYYFEEPCQFITYSFFDEMVYWEWVQWKLGQFLSPFQDAWKGIDQ